MRAAQESRSLALQEAAYVCVDVLVPVEVIVLLAHHTQAPQMMLDLVQVGQLTSTRQQPLGSVVANPLRSVVANPLRSVVAHPIREM